MTYLWIALGGAMGAVARVVTANFAGRVLGLAFPYGTLVVNIIGSFAMGVIMAWIITKYELPENIRLFLATGFLGAYTTFSTFSLDVWGLFERAAYGQMIGYVTASVLGSIAALFLGIFLVQNVLVSQ